MSGTKFVFIGGTKGGVGKSSTSHLICLGATLRNQPASFVLTDPDRKVRGEGRPYSVLDGRNPETLARILSAARNTLNGWLIIDGGGNRPAFDEEMYQEAELTLLPFGASEECFDTVAADMQRLPKAIAWPTAWPANEKAAAAAQYLIEGLKTAFPLRVITTPSPFVNSVSELLTETLGSPSTPVRNLARKVFNIVSDEYEAWVRPEEEADAIAV